ncbi:cysteine synthase A [Enterococcus hulanensis]|uniref:Cysteine synthase n=1 Tax=Enterococcus hulanensis TaxID=2559929 RepID=A0ABU3F4H2_9ENTE|nr:cysteine synthase A [Enterococcus hulanensis]MDT2602033.1 cysteine synthase A [Enterococcus hulanensis]MDT2611304.1 cysteine synthase A [Enterococcus hulanensis]MDT2615844.1 cysteine synthase A [Enterococcus hulanensis]MDT2630105.1 cysteine synthase A [Enterococcus hulanensis]MDT2657586.1 cysteine synthase A [Enterococcus hulanensis]
MTKIYNSILDTIGETPIVKLRHMTTDEMAQIYVKVESFNPGGSVKDRIALRMIEDAEKSGKLKAGMTIIEPTSGNTGIGLAMVGAAKGYPVTLVMPETMSVERRKLMQAYGANLVLTPGSEGMKGAIAKAKELADENGWFVPAQFDNPANPKVHEETTAKEIVNAFEKNELDAFVAGVGTGGTITGVGNELKRMYSNIKIYAVEPEESPVLEGGQSGPHKIQGIGAGFVPSILNTEIYDEVLPVNSSDAMETAREIAKKEGILVGVSSGAALFAALKVAKEMSPDQKVLVLLPDNGERYLSTELFEFNQ